MVFRATSPGGPWTGCVTPDGLPLGTNQWTDTGIVDGIRYFYRVAPLHTENGYPYFGGLSERAMGCRFIRLERNPSDETAVKHGYSVFATGTPINGCSAVNAFDGDLGSFADMSTAGDFPQKIGIDFGRPVGLAYFKAYPRDGATGWSRLSNAVLCGVKEAGSAADAVRVISTEIASLGEMYETKWYTSSVAENPDIWRYAMIERPDNSDSFFCNAAEIQFYGWDPWTPVEAGVFYGPSEICFASEENGLRVSWAPGGGGVRSYTLLRKGNGAWETIAMGLTANDFLDTGLTMDGTRYTYKVIAVGPDEKEGWSDETSIVPYPRGNGTGLQCVCRQPFSKTDYNAFFAEENIRSVRTDPSIDFDWGKSSPCGTNADVSALVDNVSVTWSGRLVIPFDGDYWFKSTVDDYLSVVIDDECVLWRAAAGDPATVTGEPVHLTAGEHPIRVDYTKAAGGQAKAKLVWGGAVDEAVIPPSQLIPAPPASPFAPDTQWAGYFPFDQYAGYAWEDSTTNTVKLFAVGGDFWEEAEGYTWLWRQVTGDFDISFKVTQTGGDPGAWVHILVKNSLVSGFGSALAPTTRIKTDTRAEFTFKARLGDDELIDDYLSWRDPGTRNGWLRLRREGDVFTSYYKAGDDSDWKQFHQFTDNDRLFGRKVYVGPAAANNSGSSKTAIMSLTNYSFKLLNRGTVLQFR